MFTHMQEKQYTVVITAKMCKQILPDMFILQHQLAHFSIQAAPCFKQKRPCLAFCNPKGLIVVGPALGTNAITI